MSAVLKRVTIDLVLKSYSMLISYTVKLGCYNNIFKCNLYIQKMTLKKINIQQLLLDHSAMKRTAQYKKTFFI